VLLLQAAGTAAAAAAGTAAPAAAGTAAPAAAAAGGALSRSPCESQRVSPPAVP
jgi:hypothetical protein